MASPFAPIPRTYDAADRRPYEVEHAMDASDVIVAANVSQPVRVAFPISGCELVNPGTATIWLCLRGDAATEGGAGSIPIIGGASYTTPVHMKPVRQNPTVISGTVGAPFTFTYW